MFFEKPPNSMTTDEILVMMEFLFRELRDRRRADAKVLCKSCGKAMVRRKSKHGEFLGCSGYPACKHTERMMEGPSGMFGEETHAAYQQASSTGDWDGCLSARIPDRP